MNSEIIVLKFGSSVLRSSADLSDAVHEIYRYLRYGRKVLAIVSAFEGITNQLLLEAARFGPRPEPHGVAALAATGEQQVAAQLALALAQFGIPSRLADPRDISLAAIGSPLDSEPHAVDTGAIIKLYRDATVLVLPGFFAVDPHGRCVLFGRGGSDQTALFLAQALKAECLLLKDVDGVYDRDPNSEQSTARRFATIAWADAARVADRLIQPKALHFAEQQRLCFHVAATGREAGTTIGAESQPPVLVARPSPLRVVLLGLGTVGLGVYCELARRPDLFRTVRIAARRPERHLGLGLPAGLVTSDVFAAVSEPADIVIELMGGLDPAGAAIERALTLGRPVVTANKALLAARIDSLTRVAEAHGVTIRYSAAVGGAVPMIEALLRSRSNDAGNTLIAGCRGILNGTCNFILEQLQREIGLACAVATAQAQGFAEADPQSDLSGADSAAKLVILAYLATGIVPTIPGIDGIDVSIPAKALAARSSGRSLRQVATLTVTRGQPSIQIKLEELAPDDWLNQCAGEDNALEITRTDGLMLRLTGRGAGRYPSTVAVMADVYDLWRRAASYGQPSKLVIQ